MDSGFVPLPRRPGKRGRGLGITGQVRAAPPAAPSHSYTIDTSAAAVRALGAPLYDSADSGIGAGAGAGAGAQQPPSEGDPSECIPPGAKWEYLDHTADVQIHSWGDSLPEAYAQAGLSMWGYMTDISRIKPDAACERVIEAEGVDLVSLLFAWLDGCLSAFTSEDFIGSSIAVTHWGQGPSRADEAAAAAAAGVGEERGEGGEPTPKRAARIVWRITALARGEIYSMRKGHTQGTEVKAITYSNMQIYDVDGALHTANDVAAAAAAATAAGGGDGVAGGDGEGAMLAAGAASSAVVVPGARSTGVRRGPADIYVIVDI